MFPPDAARIVSSQYSLRLSGDQWGLALELGRVNITLMLRQLISNNTGVPVFWVEILSLNIGSLVVEFRMFRNGSYAIGDEAIRGYVAESNFTRLAELYYLLTNDTNSSVGVLGLFTTVQSSVTAGTCGTPCMLGAAIGGTAGGLVLLVTAVFLARRWKRLKKEEAEAREVFDVLHDVPPSARRDAKKLLKKQAAIEDHRKLSKSPTANPGDLRDGSPNLTDGEPHEPIAGSPNADKRRRRWLSSKPSRFTRRLTAGYDRGESVKTTSRTLAEIRHEPDQSDSSDDNGVLPYPALAKGKQRRNPPTLHDRGDLKAAHWSPGPPTAAALAPVDISQRLRTREFVVRRGSTPSPSRTRTGQSLERRSPFGSQDAAATISAGAAATVFDATESGHWWGTNNHRDGYTYKSPAESPSVTPRRSGAARGDDVDSDFDGGRRLPKRWLDEVSEHDDDHQPPPPPDTAFVNVFDVDDEFATDDDDKLRRSRRGSTVDVATVFDVDDDPVGWAGPLRVPSSRHRVAASSRVTKRKQSYQHTSSSFPPPPAVAAPPVSVSSSTVDVEEIAMEAFFVDMEDQSD